jgi:hypothetical protein
VADYRPTPRRRRSSPREDRVRIREEVRFVSREHGTFSSAFGGTMGDGCGCLVSMPVVSGVWFAGLVLLA